MESGLEALAFTFVPSPATRSTVTRPSRAQIASTCTNRPVSASLWRRTKRATVDVSIDELQKALEAEVTAWWHQADLLDAQDEQASADTDRAVPATAGTRKRTADRLARAEQAREMLEQRHGDTKGAATALEQARQRAAKAAKRLAEETAAHQQKLDRYQESQQAKASGGGGRAGRPPKPMDQAGTGLIKSTTTPGPATPPPHNSETRVNSVRAKDTKSKNGSDKEVRLGPRLRHATDNVFTTERIRLVSYVVDTSKPAGDNGGSARGLAPELGHAPSPLTSSGPPHAERPPSAGKVPCGLGGLCGLWDWQSGGKPSASGWARG